MRKNTKRTLAIVGVTGVLISGGVAWAAWTSSGEGAGTVTSTTAINSKITATGSGTALYPGATTTFTVTIDNPNAYPVRVVSIAAGQSAAVGDCAAGSVVSDAATPAAGPIAPGATGTYTLTAHMIADPAGACAGQSFTVPLTAQLASAA